MRDSGKTYAAVAKTLGLERARDAQAAFVRALHSRKGEERARLTEREGARLDKLEERIRAVDAADPERMARRLTALRVLREKIG